MSGSSMGLAKTFGYTALAVALCMMVVGAVACGGTATTESSETIVTDSSGGAISEPMTSLGGEVTTSETAATTSGSVAEGVDPNLVGTWHSDQTGETMQFTADGRLIVTSAGGAVTEMTYTADGSNISYIIGGAVVYTGTYSIDMDVLSQVDPSRSGTVYFQRVE